MNYTWFEADFGRLLLAGNSDGLKYLLFESGNHLRFDKFPRVDWTESNRHLGDVQRQLKEWFAGKRTSFDLPLAPKGTPFQKRVWKALEGIPFGETRSYGEIAKSIGQPSASRAVGAANGANPISIIVPCHRVIGSSGKLTGFGGGLDVKRWLLEHEQEVTGSRLEFA